MATRRPSRTGQETRDRILDAALETVRTEGLVGASARAIARTGDFNQALLFYHFGSVDDLLLAALNRANDRRIERFRPRLDAVEDLHGFVEIARQLHAPSDEPDHPALAAMVAGWSATSHLGPRVLDTLRPWNELVANSLRRVLGQHRLGQFVPTDDLAYAMSALFLGIEMMSRLDEDDRQTESLFLALAALARLGGPMLDAIDTSAGRPGAPQSAEPS